jgi:photosystem II stability/assembly factor-like uncharacterized protein
MSLPRLLDGRTLLTCAMFLLPALLCMAAPIDLLDTPASASAHARSGLINGLALAGARVVAVGQRGHILYSDNRGRSWIQVRSPVSTDLVAVHFPTPRLGWAVGHDGVVLHSADAGESWQRQLDLRTLGAHAAAPAFLDVWFEDAQRGFAVGAFNLILATSDGGRTWQSWSARVDNPKGHHMNAIRAIGAALFIVGEHGLVLKRNADRSRFVALATPYQGSFFGIAGSEGRLLAFGLRGNAWRSTDGGAHWRKVATGVTTGLIAASNNLRGRLLLVSQAGQVLLSTDGGASFTAQRSNPGAASTMLALTGDTLVIGGVRGLRTQPLHGK